MQSEKCKQNIIKEILIMKLKKIICFILVISMMVIPFIAGSCGDKTNTVDEKQNQKADTDDKASDSTPGESVDPKAQYDPKLDPVDMGGYVFKFGTRDDDAPYHQYAVHTRDLFAEKETGDLINDAVYKRNTFIEEKYNCKFAMDVFLEASGENQANAIVEKSVKAGDKSYDLLLTHMMMGVDTAVKGCFYDIAKFPNIDIAKPYWNKGANEGCSIGNKLYVGLSDLSFSTNENLYCLFFNKGLLQNYGIDDPYKLVTNNKWTFDKFNEIIRVGAVDLNGDSKMDDNDQYGYISTASVNFLWSGGSHMMKKDEFDIPVFDFMNERTLTIYDKTLAIVKNEFTYSKEKEWYTGKTINMFAAGQGIFYGNQLCRVNDLRATEFDFGIVPYPKLDEAQERYYSYVDGHASMMGIPLNLPNSEWTGMIIEELSYLAYKDILPVYYDVVLNVKLVRDEESIEMLKILFDSKVFDPAYVLGGDLWQMWNDNINSSKTDIVSTFEKREASALKALQKKIDAILELEN
jgi:hypothetical protein